MNRLLGGKIRNLREAKGFTQEQVSERMNCSRQKFARIENGMVDISFSDITKIANILNVNVDDITSILEKKEQLQPMMRSENLQYEETQETLNKINEILDIFYAHRRLFYSIKED